MRILFVIVMVLSLAFLGLKGRSLGDADKAAKGISIERVLFNSSELHGETVTVYGQVGSRLAIGGLGYFTLENEGQKLLVLSKGGSPQVGDEYDVTGKLNQGFALNDKEHVAIIEISRSRRY